MSKSEKKTDIWGDEYIQHYDDQGNKVGTTKVETDMWGDRYEQHRDEGGNKTGYSTNEKDMWGDHYEQHRDEGGNKTGYSTNEKDMWGDRYEQHRDESGNRTGYTTNEKDFWGDSYKQHRDHQIKRQGSATADDRKATGRNNGGSVNSSSGSAGSIWLIAIVAVILFVGFASRSRDPNFRSSEPTYQTPPVSEDTANPQNLVPSEVPTSFNPSFDCARAGEGSEAQICGSETLSEYDRELDELYQRARLNSTIEERSLLTTQQREWLVERENCMERRAQTACLIVLYQERLGDLRHLLDAERVAGILAPKQENRDLGNGAEAEIARAAGQTASLEVQFSTPDGETLARVEDAVRNTPGVKRVYFKRLALGAESILIVSYDRNPQILVEALKRIGVDASVYHETPL